MGGKFLVRLFSLVSRVRSGSFSHHCPSVPAAEFAGSVNFVGAGANVKEVPIRSIVTDARGLSERRFDYVRMRECHGDAAIRFKCRLAHALGHAIELPRSRSTSDGASVRCGPAITPTTFLTRMHRSGTPEIGNRF